MKKLVALVSLLIVVSAVLFIINQTAQVVMLAGTISPLLAKFVLYALLAFYTLALLVPLVLLLRLPKSVVPPQDEHTPEFDAYLRCLGGRLAKNPHLRTTGRALSSRAGIEEAIAMLNAIAKTRLLFPARSPVLLAQRFQVLLACVHIQCSEPWGRSSSTLDARRATLTFSNDPTDILSVTF